MSDQGTNRARWSEADNELLQNKPWEVPKAGKKRENNSAKRLRSSTLTPSALSLCDNLLLAFKAQEELKYSQNQIKSLKDNLKAEKEVKDKVGPKQNGAFGDLESSGFQGPFPHCDERTSPLAACIRVHGMGFIQGASLIKFSELQSFGQGERYFNKGEQLGMSSGCIVQLDS
ncbi:hypothetical protein CIRG_09093 [Coccidioides immitis RMSCC 2394]|uniref:Uncharacterized protein n=1 Tax=Coccidioides immitis RMSCC 2394 TaxID=404692 RepID=A0A0J6YQ27_COCIT|nr:hypothetical protein CIRG_09093 [Coccidioides immitis RMSCC 2394]